MDWIRAFVSRFAGLFRRRKAEAEMAEEMRQHLERRAQEKVAEGMAPAEARQSAEREFGGLAQLQEQCREEHRFVALEQLAQDLRFAGRSLRNHLGFTAVVVLTLALSIGACTVIYSVADSLLFHPIESPAADRLVILSSKRANNPNLPVSPADFVDWSKQAQSYEFLSAQTAGIFTLTGEGEPQRMRTLRLTANYFDLFGMKAQLGRTFRPEETVFGGDNHVVMVSFRVWQNTFGGNSDVLGRTIRLNDEPFTIIGVMPENFERAAAQGGWSDIAVPLVFSPNWLAQRDSRSNGVSVQGRLKPGVSVAQAQTELDLLCDRLAREHPDTNRGISAWVYSTRDILTRPVRTTVWALIGAVSGVLFIACANVANLLLVRATTRQREISLRIALGAARYRIVRLLLTESLLLALFGGIAGTVLAAGGVYFIHSRHFHNSVGLQQLALIQLEPRMLVVALGLSVATGLLFGLAPAWMASHGSPNEALKNAARGSTESGARGPLRSALIVFEVASSLTLLACAGLLVRSFVQLANFDPGFDPRPVAYVNVTLQGSRYLTNQHVDNQKLLAFVDEVLARTQGQPGVESAGAALILPAITVGNAGTRLTFGIAGRAEVPVNERPTLQWDAVSPGFFSTLGIRLIRGRTFAAYDTAGSRRVAVVNQTFARRYFPNEDPIGQVVRLDNGWPDSTEIVGVVSDTVLFYGEEPISQLYQPFAQVPSDYIHFAVRTRGDPARAAALLKAQIHAVDPSLAVPWAEPMTQTIGAIAMLARQRFIIQLLGAFSAIALVIAIAGIYAVIAYTVSRRTTEIGIRMALGARRPDVLRLILVQGARIVGIGLLLGVGGAFAVGRGIESMLYQTSAHDPVILAAVTLLFAAVAALACWVPARRATRVDPMVALRSD
jgi:putative ABC transport system permease protein